MRKRIYHNTRDGAERTVSRFLLFPTTLSLPRGQRTPYLYDERRWLERAKIIQRYSQFSSCWIDSRWATIEEESEVKK
jgi:hypothetical protein